MLLLLGTLLNGSPTAAAAARPRVFVQAPGTIPRFVGQPAAFGLLVPGAGATTSREDAIASLRRGKVENAVLGGTPSGRIRVDVVTGIPHGERLPVVLLELPPPGEHANTKRYPIAIVGDGYRGILTSSSTRIRGLVSVTDVAETAEALAEGRRGPIGHTAGTASDLNRLDQRLRRAHGTRGGALAIAAGLLAALGAIGFLLRVPRLARVAVLFGAAAVTASLVTSGAGVERVTPVLVVFAGLALGLAAAGSYVPRPAAVGAALAAVLVVLALDTSVNSFGPLGPHPEGGGRFYGLGNQEETFLLAPVLAAAASRTWLLPISILALVTVGWSHAGADGGGMLVFAVGLAVLALRSRGLALTPRRLALVAAGAILLGLALIGLDAAFGGSSHVTRSVGSGSVFDEIWHRWRLSWAVLTSSWTKGLLFAGSIAALVWLARHRDRGPVLEALLIAVAVSLVVNDTPVDVAGIGALGGLALIGWERTRPSVDSRPMRRPLLALPLLALVMAGCGSEGAVRATPKTVVGTVQAEAPGKAIFQQQGCNGCHTYQPAGSMATIGPDLDNLPEYAKTAKQPLEEFVRESIVKPGAYIEKGFQDVMPKQYASLPQSDIDDLVTFLTQPPG